MNKFVGIIAGMLIGIAILYFTGWSLALGSTIFPNDLAEAPGRLKESFGISSDNNQQDVDMVELGVALGYGASILEMQEEGIVANRFMIAFSIDGKPWGFIQTFRFFESKVGQYIGLVLGIMVFFAGFGAAFTPEAKAEEE